MYPEDSLGLYNAYLETTKEPFSYLLLDLTQSTNDGPKSRTNIFPYDIPPLTVYSFVGDEACEDELPHSAGAEAPTRNCVKLSFQSVTKTRQFYKRVCLERSERQYIADSL